jgi:hypothetical protein
MPFKDASTLISEIDTGKERAGTIDVSSKGAQYNINSGPATYNAPLFRREFNVGIYAPQEQEIIINAFTSKITNNLDVGGDLKISGSYGDIKCENVIHYEDSDTKIVFTADKISMQAGGVTMLDLIEDDSQDYVHVATDATKLAIGAGKDGQIYTSSDNLFIDNVTADKKIYFRVLPSGGSLATYFTINGEEERLETTKHLIVSNPNGRQNAALILDQNDADEPFISLEGTSATDGSGNINDTTGSYTANQYMKVKIGAQDYWIALYLRS